nr:PREDICTED: uncharacterized protein LOC107399013 [Tribolium castaneum]|eukprot:XP_015840137.1 PREDICTED: uncharacterized protein LOC107399013 [Tribolium castaneum]
MVHLNYYFSCWRAIVTMTRKVFENRGDFSMSVVYFVATGFFQIKCNRFLAYWALTANALSFLIMLYQFILDAKLVYIIQYGPVISGLTYVLVSLLGVIFMTDTEEFQQEFDFWDELDASHETQVQIKQHINSVTVYVILNTVLAFVTGITLILPNEDEARFHYFLKLLGELEAAVPPKIIQIFYYLYKIDFVLMFPVMTINSVRMLYFSRKFKFQVKLLVERIGAMTKNYNVDDLSLFYSARYQNDMKQKLKNFVHRHSYIAQYVAKINESIGPFVVLFAISVTLSGISVLLIAATGTFYYNKYQITPSIMLYSSTLFCAIDATETVEREVCPKIP